MQRIRIRYTKEGRVRFVSARDLVAVWERSLRRADLPIAYSEGFNPHAKVSFPDALAVGVASTGEYAELSFAAPIDPGRDLGRLSVALPEGMDITTYLEVPDGAPKLARMLPATLWELEYGRSDLDPDRLVELLDRRTAALVAAETAEVVRPRPKGDKIIDVRPAVIGLQASRRPADGPGRPAVPIVRAILRNDGPMIRPNDLHHALAAEGDPQLPMPSLGRRVAQGEPVDDGLREALSLEVEPLEPGRLAGAA